MFKKLTAAAFTAGAVLTLGLSSAQASTAARPSFVKTIQLGDMACASSAECVATGTVAGTGGATDTKDVVINAKTGSAKVGPTTLRGITQPVNVGCPTATTCLGVAYGDIIRISPSTGAMKIIGHIKTPRGDVGVLQGISCAQKICWAGGDVESQSKPQRATLVKLSSSGRILQQWTNKSPASSSGLTIYQYIACESASVCMTGYQDTVSKWVVARVVNGKITSTHTPPIGTMYNQVVCVRTRACYLFGGYPYSTLMYPLNPSTGKFGKAIKTGTISATKQSGVSGDNYEPLSCTGPTKCVVVGENIGNATQAEPASVTVVSGKVGPIVNYTSVLGDNVDGVACAAAGRCWALTTEFDSSGNTVGSFIVRV